MGSFHWTDLGELWNGLWRILLIGLGTAGLAFTVGWMTLRRRKAPVPAAATDDAPLPADADPFTTPLPNERRAAARRAGQPVVVEMSDPEETRPSQQGWVVNRSVGGLCVMVARPVPVGSAWKVRPTEAPRSTPAVRVKVKTCIADGSEWKLSCGFEKSPSYSELLAFG